MSLSRMCFWAEKNKSLAGIKPAGGDNNNMERKHSPPNYDTVDDQYHGRYLQSLDNKT